MSLWNWGYKDGIRHSRYGLTRAGEAITPPDLFAMLLLMQPKTWFALVAARVQCQLHVSPDEDEKDQRGGMEALNKVCRDV